MANTITNLSKLRIIVVPSGKTAPEITSWEGIMLFDQNTSTIKVNDHEYGLSSTVGNNLNQALNALVTAGYLTKDGDTYNGVTGATNVATMIANVVGVLPTGATTVVEAIEGAVSALETKVGEVPTGFTGATTQGATTVVQAINQIDKELTDYEATANAAITELQTGLSGLTTVVQGAQTGLVTKVANLETTVGDNSTGLVKKVNDIESTYVQTVNDLTGAVTITVNNQTGVATGKTSNITISGANITVGGNGYAGDTNVAQAIAQLDTRIKNVDTDSFVQSGSLVWGAATGIEGSYNTRKDVKTAKETGYETPYLELVIKEIAKPNDILRYTYIAATSLFNDYTGTGTATITVDINGTEISATLNNNSIQTAHIQDAQVTTVKIANYNVTENKLATSAVTTAKIKDGNVTAAKMAADSVNTAQMVNSAVTADKLSASAVTTVKINDGAVTAAKMAADSVNTTQMVDGAVTTDKIANNTITYAKLESGVASAIVDTIGTGGGQSGWVSSQNASSQGIYVSVSSDDGKVTGVTVQQDIISWEVVTA